MLVPAVGPSPEAWGGILLTAVGLAGGAGWKLRGVFVGRRQAHLRINAEAVLLRRELRASIGAGPQPGQEGVWARGCQGGFDLAQARFGQLLEFALDASGKVRRLIRAERQRFLDA